MVTDYNPETDEHVITYDMDSGQESWESFRFATSSGTEYKWSKSPPVDLRHLISHFAPGGPKPKHLGTLSEIMLECRSTREP